MIALRLALRQWLSRPLRPILCSLAIAAAVALIVGVGAGMDSLREKLRLVQEEVVGFTDGTVRLKDTNQQFRMLEGVATILRRRPEISAVGGRLEAYVRIFPPGTTGGKHHNVEVIGYKKASEDIFHPRTFVAGGYPKEGDLDGMILDEFAAKEFNAKVGDEITLDGMIGKPHKMKVAGIVQRVALTAGTKMLVMAPIEAFARDIGLAKPEYNLFEIQFHGRPEGKSQEALIGEISKKLGDDYKVMPIQARKKSLERTSERMDFLIIALSIISGISATIIIATTLSVGVQERIRQFGQLRCVGASRWQLVTILAAEAILLAVLGVAIGLLIGYLGSRGVISRLPKEFPVYVLRDQSLLIAICIGIIATFIGASIPAWRVSRITPMQAVSLAGKPARKRGVYIAAIVGLSLLAIQSLLWILSPREFQLWSYFFVGIPFIFAGYCLLAPAVLLLLQRAAAYLFGTALRVKPALLRQSWSQTPWRAGAMIAALMIGVVMYAAVRLRTEGIATNWDFPKVFPDVIMLSGNGAAYGDVVKSLSAVDGVKNVTAIGIGLAKFDKRIFGTGPLLNSQNTRFAAIDVDSFRKLVELEFVQGDPDAAMERLKKGRAILVSNEFLVARKIGLGDKISFMVNDEPVEFEIAGVCKSAGIDMIRAYYDMQGSFDEEAIGTIIGTMADGEKYFNVKVVNVALVNLELNGRSSEQAIKALKDRVNGDDPHKRTGSGLVFNDDSNPNDQLSAFVTNPTDLLSWQAASVIDIKNFVGDLIRRTVRALTIIAVAAMCIASLGVANMVIASMHARKFEFGVLRAIGTGRGQLLRMVLAEVSVVALVAGLLGSLAALHYTFMGSRIDRLLVGFNTPFITWELAPKFLLHIATAIAVTLAFSWLAALIPAVRTAYKPQRELLAQGRT